MDFFELEAFYVLSQNLHFARTADKIHLSPSALSRLIARLEAETGATLLDRGTRQVRLTEEGRQFARFARESIKQVFFPVSQFPMMRYPEHSGCMRLSQPVIQFFPYL